MFASVVNGEPPPVVVVDLSGWIAALPTLAPGTDRDRIEVIALLERLTSVAAGVQAVITDAFTRSQLAAAAAAGTDGVRARRSVAAQIGLARRESPHRGRQHVGLAAALVADMPHTLAGMLAGSVPQWRATLVARQFGCLTAADRRRADSEIGPRLPFLGDRAADGAALAIAARLDAEAVVGRIKAAVGGRRVSLRPAPDGMSRLSAVLPLADGVGVWAALSKAADHIASSGTADAGSASDEPAGRGRGQVMADTLVARVTGRAGQGCDEYGVPAAAPAGVELSLIMTDRALLDDDDEPATIAGFGAVPAALARRLVAGADEQTRVWVRRLYTDPDTNALVAAESARRLFPEPARRFLLARDQICRTPWCDAPIRHLDHITPARVGGVTALNNGQGLCQACNYTKEAPGWTSRVTTVMRKLRARQQRSTRRDTRSEKLSRNAGPAAGSTGPTGPTGSGGPGSPRDPGSSSADPGSTSRPGGPGGPGSASRPSGPNGPDGPDATRPAIRARPDSRPGRETRKSRRTGAHTVEIFTPTGHRYLSTAPPLPTSGPWDPWDSHLDRGLTELFLNTGITVEPPTADVP